MAEGGWWGRDATGSNHSGLAEAGAGAPLSFQGVLCRAWVWPVCGAPAGQARWGLGPREAAADYGLVDPDASVNQELVGGRVEGSQAGKGGRVRQAPRGGGYGEGDGGGSTGQG